MWAESLPEAQSSEPILRKKVLSSSIFCPSYATHLSLCYLTCSYVSLSHLSKQTASPAQQAAINHLVCFGCFSILINKGYIGAKAAYQGSRDKGFISGLVSTTATVSGAVSEAGSCVLDLLSGCRTFVSLQNGHQKRRRAATDRLL